MEFDDLELSIELQALRSENKKILAENSKLKHIIVDNELEEELDGISLVSVEEQICIDGIKMLAPLFEHGTFEPNDVKSLDLLVKNLRIIRGKLDSKKKHKPMKPEEVEEALRLVSDE